MTFSFGFVLGAMTGGIAGVVTMAILMLGKISTMQDKIDRLETEQCR